MAEVFDFGLQQHKIKMDGKFFENNLFAVAGDTGRRLEVQLLDSNNMVQNTTGISLRLNADVAGQATYAEAKLVDATQGLYELDLPSGMLLVPGNWQFQWQIIGTTGEKLHSFAFMGSIGSNLSEGGTEAVNFYLNVEGLKNEIKQLDMLAENLQTEFDKVQQDASTVNPSGAEVVVARGSFQTLNERLSFLDYNSTKYWKLIEYLQNATKVKVIGDSVSVGQGATGAGVTNNVMFVDTNGITQYFPNNTSKGYVNLLRGFLNRQYPNIVVENWSVGGKSVKWGHANRTSLVQEDEDVVFINYGMNDRVESQTIETFEYYEEAFLEYVDARSNVMIVMGPQPAQEYTDGVLNSPYLRDVREINKSIEKICVAKGYIFISHYDLFFEYMKNSGSSFDSLIEVGGSHPIDAGHELIWKNIQEKLHLKDDYENWTGYLGSQEYEIKNQNKIRIDTPISDDIFIGGKTCFIEIAVDHPDITSLPGYNSPGGVGGRLITIKGSFNWLYSRQWYLPRQSNLVYSRYWTGTGWSTFAQVSIELPKREQNSIASFTVPAGTYVTKQVPMVVLTLSASAIYTLNGVIALPCPYTWAINTSAGANSVSFRFYNYSATELTIPNFIFNLAEVKTAI